MLKRKSTCSTHSTSGWLSVLLCALCLLLSAIHTVAENTVRLMTMNGYFTIYGVHEVSSQGGGSSDIGTTAKYYVDALQQELDKALDFVEWRVIITEYISVGNQQNDDYATGELHFEVQAYLQPGDDESQYFREVVETLNFVLADDLMSNAPLDSMRGAHITAGSLTIADTISISEGHTNKPTSRPVVTPEKLHLLMLGDWGKGGLNGDITGTSSSSVSRVASFSNRQLGGKSGGTDYTYQASIARSMMKYVRHLNLRAVITLGDNFYTSGVTSTTDTLWTTIWKNVYLAENSPLNVPWYAVLGNHDYGSSANAEAQINRHIKSDIDDDNWRMPSHNYTQMFDIVGGGVVQIIFIDTTTLAPSVNKCCNEKGGVSLSRQALLISNQLQYIEAQLQEAALDPPSWLLVVGHYPVFSAGEHGDTTELKTYLLPLLEKYNVDAYFCGHDHISEHLQKEGVQYYVAGAGALTDKMGSKGSEGELVWAGAGYSAFAAVAATPESLTVNFVNIYGESVYSHTMLTRATIMPYTVEEEEVTASTWLLETLGVENASQAAVKLSGITILCLILSVVAVLVLDAHFVARMKSAADTHVGADIMLTDIQQSQIHQEQEADAEVIDSELGIEVAHAHADVDSNGTTRGYLTSALFRDKPYQSVNSCQLIDLSADDQDVDTDIVQSAENLFGSPLQTRSIT